MADLNSTSTHTIGPTGESLKDLFKDPTFMIGLHLLSGGNMSMGSIVPLLMSMDGPNKKPNDPNAPIDLLSGNKTGGLGGLGGFDGFKKIADAMGKGLSGFDPATYGQAPSPVEDTPAAFFSPFGGSIFS